MLRRTFLAMAATAVLARGAAAQPDGSGKMWDDLSPDERDRAMHHFYRMHRHGPHGWDTMREHWDRMMPSQRRPYLTPMPMDRMHRMGPPGQGPRPGMGPPPQRG